MSLGKLQRAYRKLGNAQRALRGGIYTQPEKKAIARVERWMYLGAELLKRSRARIDSKEFVQR